MIENIQKIIEVLLASGFFFGMILLFVVIYILSRKKHSSEIGEIVQRGKDSIDQSDKILEENLLLRKKQVENQKNIIALLEEINKKMDS